MRFIKPILIILVCLIVGAYQPNATFTVFISLMSFYLLGSFIDGMEIGFAKAKYREQFETATCEIVGYKQGSEFLKEVTEKIKLMK